MAKAKENNNANVAVATNFDAMRSALALLHNGNNAMVCNKAVCTVLNIPSAELAVWSGRLRNLWGACYAYTSTRSKRRFDSTITEEMLTEKKNEVFKLWKELIASSSTDAKKTVGCDAYDLEALTEFAWRFMPTDNGTVEAVESEKKFIKAVESYIGVKMARNAMLSDDDRETLKAYNSVKKGIAKQDEKIKALDVIINNYDVSIKGLPTSEKAFKEFLAKEKTAKETEKKEAQTKKEKYVKTLADKDAEVKAILAKIKKAE